MEPLALFDLLSPYFLAGVDLGPTFHELLSTVHVDQLDTCFDEEGVAVWGIARLDPSAATSSFSLTPNGASISGSGSTGGINSPSSASSNSVWDWHDVTFQFRITAPRSPSSLIASAMSALSGVPKVQSTLPPLFDTWGSSTAAPSDYPNVQFQLDLLLTVATVHLPFLTGAKLDPNGLLEADPANKNVKLVLPKILVTLTQDGTLGQLDFVIDSWGAATIDDPDDTGEAQLIQMLPPYALVDDAGHFGFGFDKAVLDLSDSHTPPELLSQFGVGDDWQGIYLPDLRIFVAPSGAQGLAVDVSAHDLLIGVGKSSGVSGDFELDVINENTKPHIQVIVYDAQNNTIAEDQQNGVIKVVLPQNCTLVVDVRQAVPPYKITVDGTDITSNQTFPITGFTAKHDYAVVVTDSATPPNITNLTVSAVPQATSGNPLPVPPTGQSGMALALTGGATDGIHTITLTNAQQGTVQFAPYVEGIQVSVDNQNGGAPQTLTSDTITITANTVDTVNISATWPGTASNNKVELKAWFHFDHPPKPTTPQAPPAGLQNTPSAYGVPNTGDVAPTDHIEVSDEEDVTRTTTSVPFTAPLVASSDLNQFIQGMADNTPTEVEIDGFASFEHNATDEQNATPPSYNDDLSSRRAVALAEIIQAAVQGTAKQPQITIVAKGNYHDDAVLPGGVSAQTAWGSGTSPDSQYVYADYWLAHAVYNSTQPGPSATVTAKVTGPPAVTPTPSPSQPTLQKPPNADQNRPAFFRSIKIIVRIAQSTFIALEISGEFQFSTAAQQGLQSAAQKASYDSGGDHSMTVKNLQPGNPNPADGTTDFDLIISHDDSTNTWTEQLTIAAAKNDKDGLMRWGDPVTDDSTDPEVNRFRDFMGTLLVFSPLLQDVAAATASMASWKEGLLDGAALVAAAAISQIGVLHAETITLYGGELLAQEGSAGGEAAVFLDVETDLYVDLLGIITTKPSKPIKVRYKAVGVKIVWGAGPGNTLMPIVFDASKGYSIDVTDPGTFHLPAGLADIIQVLGASIARTNPLNLEVDVGIKADLGIVSVDRAKVRWPLDPLGVPTISALGASVNIPGAFKGSGYLNIGNGGIAGSIDVTIVPISLRAKAEFNIQQTPPDGSGNTATGVAISLEVDFPAPIVLGSSGLGIYGLIALFAMHFGRTVDDPMTWYLQVKGDPTDVANAHSNGWQAEIGHWAFGAGAVLGTMDGGFVMNLKGILVLELPGPRILLFMNANVLVPSLPGLLGDATGTILATLDLDIGRGTLTIGLQVNYNLSPFFAISIPADAFFDFTDPTNFYLDLGSIAKPATVSVINSFTGSGYLEIHGHGIPDFPGFNLPTHALSGFAIAMGIDVALIWGNTSVNLYLEIGATAAVGIGFSPFLLAGSITISGQLHLFIVSVSASGNLAVTSDGTAANTTITGKICGSVSFLFFSVSGCVGFTLGPGPVTPPAPPLVNALFLQSRSPALVQGTGVDRPIDAKLADGGTDPNNLPKDSNGNIVTVPIDSIPVLKFAFSPQLDPAFTSFTQSPGNAPTLPSGGWCKRGENLYRYTIQSISLAQVSGPGPMLLNDAAGVPSVWRPNAAANGGDDRAIDLALLDWTPFATPQAVVAGSALTTTVTTTWSSVCDPAAPATSVFWCFNRANVGTSPDGWTLQGTAWPDPPDTVRSAPPPLTLKVNELWRTRVELIDSLLSMEPAYVFELALPCISPRRTQKPVQTPERAGLLNTEHPTLRNPVVQNEILRRLPQTAQFASLSHAADLAGRDSAIHTLVGTADAQRMATRSLAETLARLQPSEARWACSGRALAAPFASDLPRLNAEFDLLTKALSPLAKNNEDLADALHFYGNPLVRVRLFLWVTVELIRSRTLVLRALDPNGKGISDTVINEAIVHAYTDLPSTWYEPGGVWSNDALLDWEFLTVYGVVESEDAPDYYGLNIVATVDLPAGTDSFLLGILEKENSVPAALPPPYVVASIEGWSVAEVERETFDSNTQVQNQQTVAGALNGDPAKLPLLEPGSIYGITVNYTAESATDDGNGNPAHPTSPVAASQALYFETDSTPPVSLAPWVLCVWPGNDEPHFFYSEPITVVFATDAVEQLLTAYGETLQGHARAATFRPPASAPPNQQPIQKLFPLTPVDGVVLTPWEDAIRALLNSGAAPCINASGTSVRHGKQVFDFPLDGMTPYIFDLESDPAPPVPTTNWQPGDPPPPPVNPLYRTAFATSRYASLDEMIADINGTNTGYRHLTAGASAQLSALSANPTDAEMQAALQAAGLGALPLPKQPQVTVFWEDSPSTPVPVGVLLETPEPIRRSRQTPTPIMDSSTPPVITEWQMQPAVWLDLIETAGTLSATIAANTSGNRTYVALKNGARGNTLHLSIRRFCKAPIDTTDSQHDTALLDIALNQAPWEDL
ncbi:hypothetical protein GCM10009641_02350 [Mycobacterium cookii]|uniref:OmpA-like domain-containing protein n=1 Tax=Mycobacterium cookii TaxID=1775 RepID=A0A7I7L3Z3_9MYCO|nr:hypothetical protein [Mycobacterium cookii]MCV7329449.1 hypothetical protein [Mycobacterium cookii]BBX48719.1 hypothetical protein MCOO_47340 [Mycobacterium cookii]